MSIALPSFRIEVDELLQHVSRVAYRGKPLYYGHDGTSRYDAPTRNYGVLYLGRDLPTALLESVFHKHQWLSGTKRSSALKEIQSRLVLSFSEGDCTKCQESAVLAACSAA